MNSRIQNSQHIPVTNSYIPVTPSPNQLGSQMQNALNSNLIPPRETFLSGNSFLPSNYGQPIQFGGLNNQPLNVPINQVPQSQFMNNYSYNSIPTNYSGYQVTQEPLNVNGGNVPRLMQKKNSSWFDEEEIREEAEALRSGENADNELKKNLMFKEREVGFCQLYCHLSTCFEKILMVIGSIASIASGVGMPLMAYLSSDSFSDVGNTSEKITSPEEIMHAMEVVEDNFTTMIKRFLVLGAIMFVGHLFGSGLWSYVGSMLVYELKKRYFEAMLRQEQGWFDAHNAFEFATKVQAQMEQVEQGVGEKVSAVITSIAQFLTGIVIAFVTSWKVTLIMLCVAPFILGTLFFLVTSMKTGIIMGRKTYEKAGGIAEEVLYNIKTVASFANFEFEKLRFNRKVEIVYQLDLGTACRLGISIGLLIFFLNCTFVVGFLYGRTLIKHSYNENKGRYFTSGDVMTVVFCNLMAILGIGLVAPNLKMIQESLAACSDYFTLIERTPQIDLSQSILIPPREQIQGGAGPEL